jgi:alkylhydroperoxidase/carboxymuconolactone decarboxylase family protein YurZ
MRVKACLFGLLALALGGPLAADPLCVDRCDCGDAQLNPLHQSHVGATAIPQPQQGTAVLLAGPGPNAIGDIVGGRGPDAHTAELRAIAVYASVGNRDAVEILSRRLRKFGVTAADIQDAIDQIKLHAGSVTTPLAEQMSADAAPANDAHY